jgi:hypothetical protein
LLMQNKPRTVLLSVWQTVKLFFLEYYWRRGC